MYGDQQRSDHSPTTVVFIYIQLNTGNQNRFTIFVDSSQLCMQSMYVSVEILAATTRVEEDRGAGARENRDRSPREQGAGEGGKRENRGWEAVSTRGQAAGAEINKAIVYFLLLGIIQSKALI